MSAPRYLIRFADAAGEQTKDYTTASEALEAAKEYGALAEADVAIYKLSSVRQFDTSRLLADETRSGWFEVWSYKGSKRNSSTTYMAQSDEARVFFSLDLRVVSEPQPWGDQTLRTVPCRRPNLPFGEGS